MTTKDIQTEDGLKAALMRLIEPAVDFGEAHLEAIYHNSMVVVMIGPQNDKTIFKKPAFVELIASKLAGDDRTKNTWAKFIHLEVADNKGHIIVKRRVNLTDAQKEITVILDFVWEDNRWQIVRENILM